jgi:hypothetical protein
MRAFLCLVVISTYAVITAGCSGDQPTHRHEASVQVHGSNSD